MGEKRNRKLHRRKLLKEGLNKEVPSPFINAILRPVDCLINLRGRDPKQVLPDGQLLLTVNKYAIVPLETYKSLIQIAQKRVSQLNVPEQFEHRALIERAGTDKEIKEVFHGHQVVSEDEMARTDE